MCVCVYVCGKHWNENHRYICNTFHDWWSARFRLEMELGCCDAMAPLLNLTDLLYKFVTCAEFNSRLVIFISITTLRHELCVFLNHWYQWKKYCTPNTDKKKALNLSILLSVMVCSMCIENNQRKNDNSNKNRKRKKKRKKHLNTKLLMVENELCICVFLCLIVL